MGFIVHPSNWEIQHAAGIFRGQEYQATHDGQLPDTPMWRMLEFRHSLNSARFNHWHPNVGRMLQDKASVVESAPLSAKSDYDWISYMSGETLNELSFARESFTNTPPWDFTGMPAIVQPPQFETQAVPEPSAALQGLTALALTVAIFVKRHRLRRLMSRRA